MKYQILNAIDSPHELEAMYREHPKAFAKEFPEAFAERPDSPVLQAWKERLFFEEQTEIGDHAAFPRWQAKDIGLAIVLSLFAGTLAKLPHFFPVLDDERFYTCNLAGIIAGALVLYFYIHKPFRFRTIAAVALFFAGALAYMNILPGIPGSDTAILICLHIPLLFWLLTGLAFLGGEWKRLPCWMDYVRYNGELLVFTTIVMVGGIVLTGITIALFELIDLKIEKWYMQNVALYGAVAAPIVATLVIERIVAGRFKIAPALAKVFTPLFLLTVLAYLAAMAMYHRSPFTDRDFLLAFNGLLLVVLGLCVFSISERGGKETAGVFDAMNIGLVLATLVIDMVALAAILFRLTSYGFTPNRVAVLGANLLAFGHLGGILYCYVRFSLKKSAFRTLEDWIVAYIPAYAIWSLFVAIAFPLLFGFGK